MSFTKKVKTVMCKILIIIVLVNLLLTLINESLITCQSIHSNHNLFVYTSLEQFHNTNVYQIMVVAMSFTKKVETVYCKILIITYILF